MENAVSFAMDVHSVYTMQIRAVGAKPSASPAGFRPCHQIAMRMRTSFLLRLLCCLALCDGAPPSLDAFVISIHQIVTTGALAEFPPSALSQWERDQMARGAVDADLVEGGLPIIGGPYEPRFHFDNEFSFAAVTANFMELSKLIDTNLAKSKRDPWEFGKALHAVEDFYSHSNYVLLYRESVAKNGNPLVGSIPTFEEVLLERANYREFLALLESDLHTGRYPNHSKFLLANDTDHGLLFGPGMHKDTLQRTLHADARQTALEAAAWYIRLYVRDKQAQRDWTRLKTMKFGGTPQGGTSLGKH